MTAGERLRQLAGVSGTAAVLLLIIGTGATAGGALVNYSGLPTGTAAEHLLTDVVPSSPSFGGGGLTLAGAIMAISASLPVTHDVVGYGAATIAYTAIGEVENFGQHGVSTIATEFTPLDTFIKAKVKGFKNYGTMTCTLGSIPGNAGQIILAAASESNNRYSVKITYPDTSITYLDVLVSKYAQVDGVVNDIQKISCDLAICHPPVIVTQA